MRPAYVWFYGAVWRASWSSPLKGVLRMQHVEHDVVLDMLRCAGCRRAFVQLELFESSSLSLVHARGI